VLLLLTARARGGGSPSLPGCGCSPSCSEAMIDVRGGLVARHAADGSTLMRHQARRASTALPRLGERRALVMLFPARDSMIRAIPGTLPGLVRAPRIVREEGWQPRPGDMPDVRTVDRRWGRPAGKAGCPPGFPPSTRSCIWLRSGLRKPSGPLSAVV
jgi:hypothetical protein